MKGNDEKLVKQRIRERYKGVSEDILDVIPAKPREDFYKPETIKRVAVYARVSTDDANQTSSYELQKNHYEDMVRRKENWQLVDIYADEGISGTSLQHRDSFIRMINDCKAGKIDIIVTKSVSRFARNIMDCIGYVRQLKAANPPVGVFFETENIFTLDENSEMSLSFIATLAQEESHSKSEIMNASIEMRFRRGIFLTPPLLGYDKDENGDLVINEEEAKTVRLIFFSYLYGYSAQKIADALTELERLTKRGNEVWSAGSVLQILTNERYCGDVLARKTFTPNYLNHKSKKNKHDRNQYRQQDHHEAIISRDDYFAVQKMIRNAKYGNKGYFPEIRVIQDGILHGYVTVHPKWAGFTVDDYYDASAQIKNGQIPSKPLEIRLKKGSFDLSGYQLVRTPFISMYGQPILSVSTTILSFNKSCISKLPDAEHIEILVLPGKGMLAVRKAPAGSHNAILWRKANNGEYVPRLISGTAFLPTLYSLFGWNSDHQYKLSGTVHSKDGETVLLFNSREAVLLYEDISAEIFDQEVEVIPRKKRRRKEKAFPSDWADSFGEEYYTSQGTFRALEPDGSDWQTHKHGIVYSKESDINVTRPQKAAENIKQMLTDMGVSDD